MSPEELADRILAEIEQFDDWVSIADVLKALGTTSFVADQTDVKVILDCVNMSDRLRLGHVRTTYEEIRKPIDVSELLDTIFSQSQQDRSARMMELFIADA